MKKLIVLIAFIVSLGVMAQPPTDVRGQLEDHENNSGMLSLGCCPDDPDNDPDQDESLCVQRWYVIDTSEEAGGDFIYTGKVTFRNCLVSVVGGGNFVINSEAGAVFNVGTNFCPATTDIVSGTLMFNSLAEYQQTLSLENFVLKKKRFPENKYVQVVSIPGQIVTQGSTNKIKYSDLKKGFYIIRFDDLRAFKHVKL